MKNLSEIKESGLLEAHIMGILEEQEEKEVLGYLEKYPELQAELSEIETVLEYYAHAHAIAPHPAIKPLLIATVDYTERLTNGEVPVEIPPLHKNSKLEDYQQWLDRPDMVPPENIVGMYAKIIGFTPKVTSAIVWLTEGAPPETHTDEYEKFLIAEGTCDISFGGKIHHLSPGDFLAIPLHLEHTVKVTSSYPCKIVLQRAAA